MEMIDASGPNAMFGDDDMNFDLDMEQFGVDTRNCDELPESSQWAPGKLPDRQTFSC